MYFFEDYSSYLRDFFSTNNISKSLDETLSGVDGEKDTHKKIILNSNRTQIKKIDGPKVIFRYNNSIIESLFGKNLYSFDKIEIGTHPDFHDIKENDCLYHHCVFVFIDIVGSTKLIGKYNLENIRLLKDSILTLSIRVASQFGGHVQRLQGDGIFLQFVRKDKNELDSIINALNAASMLTSFITTDLAEIMQDQDIEPLEIRIGIDYGKKEEVLWSYYGIPGCGELTTTSLHTDMAAKLQGKAEANTILIGDNVREALDLEKFAEEHHESPYKITKNFVENLKYKFYKFDWQNYLLSHPFICKNNSDSPKLKVEIPKNIPYITCYITDQDGSNKEDYFSNSKSIPKHKNINYTLMQGDQPYIPKLGDKIEWYVYNTGKEARKAGKEKFDISDSMQTVTTTALYLGHHRIECKISNKHNIYQQPKRLLFSIFVR